MIYSCDLCDIEGIVADYDNFEDYQKHCKIEHDYEVSTKSQKENKI